MKVPAKYVFAFIFCITVFRLPGMHAQVPFQYKVSAVLNLSLPDYPVVDKNGFVNTCSGGDTLESYEVTYFDTIVVKINSAPDFNLALKSFVAGKFAGEEFKSYDLRVTDTVIGNLPGLFIRGTTEDTLQEIKKFHCFATIANSNSYWFYYYLRSPSLPTAKAESFFSSIQFNRNKIKEAAFKADSFKKHKVPGKTWYLSPELDYPVPAVERTERNLDKTTYPPKPPPPPIRREWIVKAGKLASDYTLNPSLADKKYKKNYGLIIVEGTIKEIKETDDRGITIIVLDGKPSKTDVQCEILNSWKIKNLKKGMKALFDAHCEGINGNVILSRCSYIEKPAYE